MAVKGKTLTVTQEVKELIYDIQNKAFLTGRAREAEGTKSYEAASNMQASDDDDRYQIRRSLANAFASMKSLLGEYLYEEKSTSDNRVYEEIDNDGQLTLSLQLPCNYNDASADSLSNGIHSYLVDTALVEWFTITDKEDAQAYIAHLAGSIETIKKALYKRSRPARPTYD